MNNNKSEIIAILDRSGSMRGLESDTIGGFNSFLQDQKEVDGEANLTLVLFDNEYDKIHNAVDINDVKDLDEDTYKVRGTTALLDAVGRTIDDVGDRLDTMDEDDKPSNVIFFILTDGHENSSSDYTNERIKEMIEHQENKYNWEFIYGGANQDAFAVAGGLNIKASNTFNYSADSKGTRRAYKMSSQMVTDYRNDNLSEDPDDYDDDNELKTDDNELKTDDNELKTEK